MSRKKPRANYRPRNEKKPVIGRAEPEVAGAPLAWRFGEADRSGPFAWSSLNDPVKYKEIVEKLGELEGRDWAAITKGGSHSIPVENLSKAARDRLVEIKKSDIDEIRRCGSPAPSASGRFSCPNTATFCESCGGIRTTPSIRSNATGRTGASEETDDKRHAGRAVALSETARRAPVSLRPAFG